MKYLAKPSDEPRDTATPNIIHARRHSVEEYFIDYVLIEDTLDLVSSSISQNHGPKKIIRF
jgi:hypothetical protein